MDAKAESESLLFVELAGLGLRSVRLAICWLGGGGSGKNMPGRGFEGVLMNVLRFLSDESCCSLSSKPKPGILFKFEEDGVLGELKFVSVLLRTADGDASVDDIALDRFLAAFLLLSRLRGC